MDIKGAAHCFIISYNFNIACTAKLQSEVFKKFIGLHLKTVNIVLLLGKTRLTNIEDSISIFRKLIYIKRWLLQ